MMLICKYCGKVIANTNPVVHYGLCADCGRMPRHMGNK
jgi:hypothetical protein